MGRKSTKKNKNKYFVARETAGLSREEASELVNISEDRLYRIETDKANISPDEVHSMAKGYNAPDLCNHFCTNECTIGIEYVTPVTMTDLQDIVVKMNVSLTGVQKKRDRLLEIAADNTVDDDQIEDFINIQEELEEIGMLVDTLRLWSEHMLAEGKINKAKYDEIKEKMEQ